MPEILSTIFLCGLILAALFFSIRKLVRDKRAGKGCCGCGSCPAASQCKKKAP